MKIVNYPNTPAKKLNKLVAKCKGYLTRKQLKQPKDEFTKQILKLLLNNHISTYQLNKFINKTLKTKKIRNQNFPSEISENIAKFAIQKYTKGYTTR